MPRNEALEMSDLISSSSSARSGDDSGNESARYANGASSQQARRRSNTTTAANLARSRILTRAEMGAAERSFWRRVIVNTILIGLWYLFSISITVYNKWMFNDENGKQKVVFPFPLFTTCVHMAVQFFLASIVLYFVPKFRPGSEAFDPHAGHSRTTQPPRDPSKPLMTRWFYISRIGPCGAATGLDIGLGNMSFKFITLTFYTMCKSSVLGWVLLFAFLFGLEKPSWKLLLIIATMIFGVFLMVAGEAAFNLIGFLLIMASSASSGFRWSLTQILLIRHPATSNPFSTVFFLAPIMFTTLFIIAFPVEGFRDLLHALGALAKEKGSFSAALILLFPGCLAFCMTASEFALLQRTSVVTLSICGIFKEVLTISTASIVFHDKLTPVNTIGLVITISTIATYNYIKMRAMRDDAAAEVQEVFAGEYAPVAGVDEDDDVESAIGGAEIDGRTGRKRTDGTNRLTVAVGGRSDRSTGDGSSRASPIKRPEDLE